MYKRFLSLTLVLVMVIALAIPAIAGPTPVAGDPAWKDNYSSVAAEKQLIGEYYDRGNASGDKISSNAHSGDYPGVYFRWDDKQKMPGVFLVNDDVFDLFVDGVFYLTAKNSNSYYKYEISRETGALKDGVWVYGIPKEVMGKDNKGKDTKDELKNINMVFIDGNYKSAYFEIEKVWLDAQGFVVAGDDSLVSFKEGWKLGINEVKITDYTTAVNGKKVTVTEKAINGFTTVSANPQSLTVKWNDDPVKGLTFENQADPIKLKGTLSIEKWIDGDIAIAWDNPTGYALSELMSFEIYAATEAKDGYTGAALATSDPEYLDDSGVIFFDYEFTPGWYAVVEVLSEIGQKYFAVQPALYIYVSDGDNTYAPIDGVSVLESGDGAAVYNMITDEDGFTVVVDVPQYDFWMQNITSSNSPEFVDSLLGGGAEFVWDVVDTLAYGYTGSWIRITDNLEIPGEIDGDAIFYLACDNAALVFVNGEYAGGTEEAFINRAKRPQTIFGNLNHGDFDSTPEAWRIIYGLDITELLVTGNNEIIVYAANTMDDPENYPEYQYNTDNNPCGVIYSCSVGYKGVRFDNDTVEVLGEIAVVPMISETNEYVSASDSWGYQCWGDLHASSGNFNTPMSWLEDEDDFDYENLLANAEFIWDKTQAEVNEGQSNDAGFGFDTAYIKYEYSFEDAVPGSLVFTDFNIAADNEFALLVNGKVVATSNYLHDVVGDLSGKDSSEIAAIWDNLDPDNYWPLNDGDPVYDWTYVYTVLAEDMLAAVNGSDAVVIEIYAFNAPEICYPHVQGYWGNPCMVIFAGSFKYDVQ